jgi:hypothetical protein
MLYCIVATIRFPFQVAGPRSTISYKRRDKSHLSVVTRADAGPNKTGEYVLLHFGKIHSTLAIDFNSRMLGFVSFWCIIYSALF